MDKNQTSSPLFIVFQFEEVKLLLRNIGHPSWDARTYGGNRDLWVIYDLANELNGLTQGECVILFELVRAGERTIRDRHKTRASIIITYEAHKSV